MAALTETQNRAYHCLLGQYIGDALGTRYEFMPQTQALAEVRKDMAKHKGQLLVLGGGPFELLPGQATDDTELAMALARSLVRKGQFDVDDVALGYVTWFKSPPFDIGHTTRAAFYGVGSTGTDRGQKMIETAGKNNKRSLSNGCLMRASPLGIACRGWSPENAIKAAKTDASLTHPRMEAQDAVAAYVRAIAVAIQTGDKQAAYQAALDTAETETIQTILKNAKDEAFDPNSPGGMGYLGIALQRAFHELLSERSFYESMYETVVFGGDTDTNGCITGALLGSVMSGDDGIPEQWVKAVLECKPHKRLRQYPYVDSSDLQDVALGLLNVKEQVD